MRSRAVLGYSLLFFLSGATGLVYELLWVRLLYQAFGATIQSVTTVVAAYMGGLGLGAWWFGRRADRHPRPAALYGWLELAIGAFAALSPLALTLVRQVYVALATGLHAGAPVSVALRFGLAALVLLVPTTLMGGTLPVLTRAFAGSDRAALQPTLGRLYGLNTLGAVLGTALAGFVLIEHVGIRASLWGTALVNFAIGAAAIALAKPLAPLSQAPVLPPPIARPASGDTLRRLALALLGLTAFAALLDEIAWTRVLVMIVGGSTYAFTLVLLTFLLGIGLGSAFVARVGAAARPVTAASAGAAQGVTAAGAAMLFLFFGQLPRYILAVFQFPGATARLALLGLAVGAVVLVPAIGMGMTFPLLTDLVAREDEARGADVGRAYALNTLGSIAGAVLTGFVLVVWLGSDRTLRIGLWVNGLAALALVALAARGVAEGSEAHRRLRARVLGGGVLAVLALAIGVVVPPWSTRLFDLGPTIYGRGLTTPDQRQSFLEHAGMRQLAFREGWNATVSAWESAPGRSLKVNGKADASDHGDMDTELLLGIAPVALRPGASTGLVIGFGSGVTTRALADVPGMRRVRVVEIEPAVLEMARYFLSVNDTVLARPTGHLAAAASARRGTRRPTDGGGLALSTHAAAAAAYRPLRRDRLGAEQPLAGRRRDPVYTRVLPHRPRASGSRRRLLPMGAALPAAAPRGRRDRPQRPQRVSPHAGLVQLAMGPDGARRRRALAGGLGLAGPTLRFARCAGRARSGVPQRGRSGGLPRAPRDGGARRGPLALARRVRAPRRSPAAGVRRRPPLPRLGEQHRGLRLAGRDRPCRRRRSRARALRQGAPDPPRRPERAPLHPGDARCPSG